MVLSCAMSPCKRFRAACRPASGCPSNAANGISRATLPLACRWDRPNNVACRPADDRPSNTAAGTAGAGAEPKRREAGDQRQLGGGTPRGPDRRRRPPKARRRPRKALATQGAALATQGAGHPRRWPSKALAIHRAACRSPARNTAGAGATRDRWGSKRSRVAQPYNHTYSDFVNKTLSIETL